MALQIDDNTDFNYLVPLAPSDGNLVAINHENGLVNLLFYQARKQTGDHIDKVDVTGAILMNVKDLKRLRDAITENLEQHENREP
jgi:hypothetical protein